MGMSSSTVKIYHDLRGTTASILKAADLKMETEASTKTVNF
jgi:hypothetical protein